MSHDAEKTTKLAILIARVIPLPALIGGAVMLYFGVKEIYLARQSVAWPTADGIIQNSSVKWLGSSRKRVSDTRAEILYQFAVDGQTRKGNMIAFGVTGSSCSYVENIVNRYPTGTTVKVYYRANAPDTCILEPGLQHGQFWFMPSFGLFLFLSMGLLAIFLPRAISKKEEQASRGRRPSRGVVCTQPPRSISLRKDGQVLELTLRKNRLALLISFAAVLLGPILFIYIGFAIKGVPMFIGILGVVFLAAVLIGYTRALSATETVRVGVDKIEIRRFKLWSGVAAEMVRTSDIKGVTVEKADNSWSVNIAVIDGELGEEMSISVGSRFWVSFGAAEWIRNCILQVLETAAAQSKKSR
jgi:uncharacterized membrane protein